MILGNLKGLQIMQLVVDDRIESPFLGGICHLRSHLVDLYFKSFIKRKPIVFLLRSCSGFDLLSN